MRAATVNGLAELAAWIVAMSETPAGFIRRIEPNIPADRWLKAEPIDPVRSVLVWEWRP